MERQGVTVYIYGLYASDDPLQEIRYIGKALDPSKRLIGHLRKKDQHEKRKWIQEVQDRGAKIEMLVIEQADEATWQRVEREYIECLKDSNRMFNIYAGGGATFGGTRKFIPKRFATLIDPGWRYIYGVSYEVEDYYRRESMHLTYNADA